LAPLDYHELVALGRLLPVPDHTDRGLILALRGEAARRLCQAPGASVRRPALAAVLLGAVRPGVAGGFSAAAAYREIYRHTVLGVLSDGRPRFPHRGRAVRAAAELACRRGRMELRLDDPELDPAGFIDRATGERSADFRGLLEADVLVERCEEFDAFVSFADQRLLEFAAALALGDRPLADALAALAPRAEAFTPAGAAAAHLLVLAARSGGASAAAAVAARPFGEVARLTVGTALVDAESFRLLLSDLARLAPEATEEAVRQLLAAGEPRLAADAARALTSHAPPDRVRADEVAYLHAFALYDVDDYEGAERRLPSDDRSPRALTLRADIAVGRGDFARARDAYEELVRDDTAGPLERGNALRGLGYVLGRLGRLAEADTVLAQAVELLRRCGDTLELAEALGDHGDVLTRLDRLAEARVLLEEDGAVCRRLGRPACEGIATALTAEVDWREGDRESAERRLRAALGVVRGVSYRWREAWLLRRLAELCDEQGRAEEARELQAEAARAFADLGSAKQ
jgi:tetratricopeptide (TPR) repeat protein